MKIYLFDVDKTLEISRGCVTFESIVKLKSEGNIVGLCGNWGVVTLNTRGWENLFSFLNIGVDKVTYMRQIKLYIPAEDYVMIGNDVHDASCGSPNDKAFAEEAGWRFIKENDFANGIR